MSTHVSRLLAVLLLLVAFALPAAAQSTAPSGRGGTGVGGGLLTSNPDDGSIAAGATNSDINAFGMAFDGSVWRRITFGTAGTPSSQVTTIQGISGGTNVNVNCAVGCAGSTPQDADDASIATGQTNANSNALSMIYDGAVWRRFTLGTAGSPSTQVVSIQGVGSGTAVPVSGTFWQATQPVSLASVPTHTVNAGTGFAPDATHDSAVSATGPQILLHASNALPSAVTADSEASRAWGDRSGRLAASPAANPNNDFAANRCVLASAATTNATNCKASAGNLYYIRAINTTATQYYLRLYNLAAAPTCSSATGFVESIPIPAAVGSTSGGFVEPLAIGEAYSAGVGFCITGGASSTDNTVAGTGIYIKLLVK